MPKPTLRDCIFEGLMEIKKLQKVQIFWRTIDQDIPFAASFLAGWIQESKSGFGDTAFHALVALCKAGGRVLKKCG